MKLKIAVKTVLFCSLSYYLIYRLKLHFSIDLSFSNKNALFLLLNFFLLLTLIIHNFSSTSVTNDEYCFYEELTPCQSDAIIIQGDVSNNYSTNDERVVEKPIILVEKFAKEEDDGKRKEEIILDTVLSKEANTGWRRNPIQKHVQRFDDLVGIEDLAPKVKEIFCVDEKLDLDKFYFKKKNSTSKKEKMDKLDLDAVNKKYEEFIRIQKRKWRLDATQRQLQLVKI